MIDDDGESINSLKRQRLESLTELDEFETPEQDTNPLKIEDPTPMNPIDFYDNQDGFWDEFIIRKREKLSKVKIHPFRGSFIH